LRSGEYQQGTNCLRNSEDEYCCLGVACKLFHESTGKLEPIYNVRPQRYAYGSDRNILPAEVKNWLGLRECAGDFGARCLSFENDKGKSFAEIADIIESEPEGLFVETEH